MFSFLKPKMPTATDALPGRSEPILEPKRHTILGTPIAGPYPDGSQIAEFALGCFWGEEKTFWEQPGVWTTAVGYQDGYTPNATYREVCTGQTGHTPHRPRCRTQASCRASATATSGSLSPTSLRS